MLAWAKCSGNGKFEYIHGFKMLCSHPTSKKLLYVSLKMSYQGGQTKLTLKMMCNVGGIMVLMFLW